MVRQMGWGRAAHCIRGTFLLDRGLAKKQTLLDCILSHQPLFTSFPAQRPHRNPQKVYALADGRVVAHTHVYKMSVHDGANSE